VRTESERYPTDRQWSRLLLESITGSVYAEIAGTDAPIAHSSGKVRLHARTGAKAVDMESHIAARIAALHNIPFAICRTIIDAADRDLPPAAVIELRHDGTPDVLAILRSVMDQPNQVPALVRIATDAWTARKALRRGRRLLGGGLGCPYFDERASRTLDTAVSGTLPVGPGDANARYCARPLPRNPSISTDPHPALRPP
jgi:adenosylhomocysteine nucleosidase